jgi:hypothetical protein
MLQKTRRPRPKSKDFWELGLGIMGRQNSRASNATLTRQYVAFFGSEPLFISILWYLLDRSKWIYRGPNIHPCHLLWTLHFLKVYATESVTAMKLRCDEKTYREKVWFLLQGIARLDKTLVSTNMLLYKNQIISMM